MSNVAAQYDNLFENHTRSVNSSTEAVWISN